MAAEDADRCKKLARRYEDADKAAGVQGGHWHEWSMRKVEVMRRAIRAKFDQNEEMRKRLIETGTAKLVEDSSEDKFWGGAIEGSMNMLGKLLMELRESYITPS
jgi:ribA/ribD-fused uncharacterized protein